jgi:hypothetical protein
MQASRRQCCGKGIILIDSRLGQTHSHYLSFLHQTCLLTSYTCEEFPTGYIPPVRMQLRDAPLPLRKPPMLSVDMQRR